MNKHSKNKHSKTKHSKTKHSKTKHSKTKRRLKSYTKSAKRLMRLKQRTRRLSRYRRKYRMRGGAEPAPAPAPVATTIQPYSPPGGSNAAISKDMAAGNQEQNRGNMALKGGGNLDLYAYAPPPGMMGPVPQPSQNAASNSLILQSAIISTTGQANAQFDKNVNN
jgi:hypothetical protein